MRGRPGIFLQPDLVVRESLGIKRSLSCSEVTQNKSLAIQKKEKKKKNYIPLNCIYLLSLAVMLGVYLSDAKGLFEKQIWGILGEAEPWEFIISYFLFCWKHLFVLPFFLSTPHTIPHLTWVFRRNPSLPILWTGFLSTAEFYLLLRLK